MACAISDCRTLDPFASRKPFLGSRAALLGDAPLRLQFAWSYHRKGVKPSVSPMRSQLAEPVILTGTNLARQWPGGDQGRTTCLPCGATNLLRPALTSFLQRLILLVTWQSQSSGAVLPHNSGRGSVNGADEIGCLAAEWAVLWVTLSGKAWSAAFLDKEKTMQTTRDDILAKMANGSLDVALPPLETMPDHDADRYERMVKSALRRRDVFDIRWEEAGVRIGENQRTYYPQIETWEIVESMSCPVPHERIWVEIEVENPFGAKCIYGWIVKRLGVCGFTAFPVTYQGSRLFLTGATIIFDADSQVGSGRPGVVEVVSIFRDYSQFGDTREFADHSEMLSRLMRELSHSAARGVANDRTHSRMRGRPKGSSPMDRRAVVRIGAQTPSEASMAAGSPTGTVAEHHRRSHPRRLKGGGHTIVRETVVNPGRGPRPPKPQTFVV